MEQANAASQLIWQNLINRWSSVVNNTAIEKFLSDPEMHKLAAITLLALLVASVLLLISSRAFRRKRQKYVLLIGPSSSGKTALFSKLSGNDWVGTVTSQCPNFGYLKTVHSDDENDKKPSVQLVDLPGSAKLANLIPKHIKSATVIIFMIDSTEFTNQLQDIVEKLCTVLDDVTFKKRCIPLLIALNKSDLGARCYTERFVSRILKTEINKVKKQNGTMISDSQAPFDFDAIRNEVSISKISVLLDGDALEPIHEFLRKHA